MIILTMVFPNQNQVLLIAQIRYSVEIVKNNPFVICVLVLVKI